MIKQGAKLVANWEDLVEELPKAIRAGLLRVETTNGAERASLVEEGLSPLEKTVYALLALDSSKHVDETCRTGGVEFIRGSFGAV